MDGVDESEPDELRERMLSDGLKYSRASWRDSSSLM